MEGVKEGIKELTEKFKGRTVDIRVIREIFKIGSLEGYLEGYTDGYDDGHDDGYDDCNSNSKAVHNKWLYKK